MNNWDSMLMRQYLFDLFETARILFNDYVNGINRDFTKDDLKAINKLLELVDSDTKELKEDIKYGISD